MEQYLGWDKQINDKELLPIIEKPEDHLIINGRKISPHDLWKLLYDCSYRISQNGKWGNEFLAYKKGFTYFQLDKFCSYDNIYHFFVSFFLEGFHDSQKHPFLLSFLAYLEEKNHKSPSSEMESLGIKLMKYFLLFKKLKNINHIQNCYDKCMKAIDGNLKLYTKYVHQKDEELEELVDKLKKKKYILKKYMKKIENNMVQIDKFIQWSKKNIKDERLQKLMDSYEPEISTNEKESIKQLYLNNIDGNI
jgi:hypothetical protein